MRILYYVSFPNAMGADRWIYEGWKDAFRAAGHDFFTLTERDDWTDVINVCQPDIFMVGATTFIPYIKSKGDAFLRILRTCGGMLFLNTPLDNDDSLSLLKRYSVSIDVFYSFDPPLQTAQAQEAFTSMMGKPYVIIAHAANAQTFYPDVCHEKFACDIAFVGNNIHTKRIPFEKVLFPLCKKYNVRIYGPGWTAKDKFFRIISGISRRMSSARCADFVNKQRISISLDDERRLYASAKICLNFHEYWDDGIIRNQHNDREIKIPASGGFQITDDVPHMTDFFEVGNEIVVAKTFDDWFRVIDYYLNHDNERDVIKKAGSKRALRDHTYANRVIQVLDLYAKRSI